MYYSRREKYWLVAAIVVVVVLAIVFAPILTIWALNTLFSTGIEITFKTWLAALLLGAAVSRGYHSSSSK